MKIVCFKYVNKFFIVKMAVWIVKMRIFMVFEVQKSNFSHRKWWFLIEKLRRKFLLILKFWKNRKLEGLEISVKSDRAAKSEKFFNPGWSWPTLSEFLWFSSCYQPQTQLKMSQFIRFFRLRPRGLYKI